MQPLVVDAPQGMEVVAPIRQDSNSRDPKIATIVQNAFALRKLESASGCSLPVPMDKRFQMAPGGITEDVLSDLVSQALSIDEERCVRIAMSEREPQPFLLVPAVSDQHSPAVIWMGPPLSEEVQGGLSTVSVGWSVLDDKRLAVKSVAFSGSRNQMISLQSEAVIYYTLDRQAHPHVARPNAFIRLSDCQLMLSKLRHQDLIDRTIKAGSTVQYTQEAVSELMKPLLEGVASLHREPCGDGIAVRDIKLDNILCEPKKGVTSPRAGQEGWKYWLTDMGSARTRFRMEQLLPEGSREFLRQLTPEYLGVLDLIEAGWLFSQSNADNSCSDDLWELCLKIDAYLLGTVLFSALTGESPSALVGDAVVDSHPEWLRLLSQVWKQWMAIKQVQQQPGWAQADVESAWNAFVVKLNQEAGQARKLVEEGGAQHVINRLRIKHINQLLDHGVPLEYATLVADLLNPRPAQRLSCTDAWDRFQQIR